MRAFPPLFGFYAKFAVFDAAVAAGLFPLAVIGIAASVIGAYYYLRVIKTMYLNPSNAAYAPGDSRLEGGMIVVAAVFHFTARLSRDPADRGVVARGGTRTLPLTIRTLAETGSTNADLIALAAAGGGGRFLAACRTADGGTRTTGAQLGVAAR